MATIKVQNGQSIFDIALQHCGDVAAAFDIAVLNDILLTDALAAGQSLAIPAVVNTDVVNYYKSRGIVPATAYVAAPEPPPAFTPIKFGLLYNYFAAINPLIVNGSEFAVPEKTQTDELVSYLTEIYPGYEPYYALADLLYWNNSDPRTNSLKFNARGSGGRRGFSGGSFFGLESFWGIWTKTEASSEHAHNLLISSIDYYSLVLNRYTAPKKTGLSIRLVRQATEDEAGQPDGTSAANYVGNDGKIYRTVIIGNQVWLADNLAETKYSDGSDIQEVADGATWAALTTAAMCAYNNDWTNVLL